MECRHVAASSERYAGPEQDAPFPPKLPVHFDAFIPANQKDLLFDSTIRLHANICNCSSTYLFTLILSFRLTGTVYRSTLLLLYRYTDLPVQHIYPFILMLYTSTYRSKIHLSPQLWVYMSTDVPVQQYTCSVCFFFFGVTCTMTFQLIYWGTYTQIHPKIYLPVYLHAFLSSNHKDLPVTTTTCVHAHRCTRSWPYLFMFILSFRLTV